MNADLRHLNDLIAQIESSKDEKASMSQSPVPVIEDFVDTNHQNHQDNYNGNAQPTVNLNGDDANPWKWIAITIVLLFALALLACCIWRIAACAGLDFGGVATSRPAAAADAARANAGLESAIEQSQDALRRQRLEFTRDRLQQEVEREREHQRERLDNERRRREQDRLRREERESELAWEREAERAASLRRLQLVEQRERDQRAQGLLAIETPAPAVPDSVARPPPVASLPIAAQTPAAFGWEQWLREYPDPRLPGPFTFDEFALELRREQARQERELHRLRRDQRQRDEDERERRRREQNRD